MGAYAVVLALIERRRTGHGQHVNAALAGTGAILQVPFMYDYEGKVWDEPKGPDVAGFGALQRLYSTLDGWLFLGLREDETGKLSGIEGLAAAEGLYGSELASTLEKLLRRMSPVRG